MAMPRAPMPTMRTSDGAASSVSTAAVTSRSETIEPLRQQAAHCSSAHSMECKRFRVPASSPSRKKSPSIWHSITVDDAAGPAYGTVSRHLRMSRINIVRIGVIRIGANRIGMRKPEVTQPLPRTAVCQVLESSILQFDALSVTVPLRAVVGAQEQNGPPGPPRVPATYGPR